MPGNLRLPGFLLNRRAFHLLHWFLIFYLMAISRARNL